MDNTQTKALLIRVKIIVIVKQIMVIFDTEGSYQAVDCFSHRDPL
jgi:hypothetical protein